jgi:hypothetical protein
LQRLFFAENLATSFASFVDRASHLPDLLSGNGALRRCSIGWTGIWACFGSAHAGSFGHGSVPAGWIFGASAVVVVACIIMGFAVKLSPFKAMAQKRVVYRYHEIIRRQAHPLEILV